MEVKEFKAKTVDEAITAATLELGISSDKLQYEVVDEGSKGFLGIFNSKPAVIKVILKKSLLERTQEFCDELFAAMKVETTVNIDFREEDNVMNIDLSGSDMGILIGKRGQTLDAVSYTHLTSLSGIFLMISEKILASSAILPGSMIVPSITVSIPSSVSFAVNLMQSS